MIAIKGMKMPKSCSKCPLLCGASGELCCSVTGEPEFRIKECPLVEIVLCKDCTNYVKGALDEEICLRGHELIHENFYCADAKGESKMPPKENEVELSELYALEEQVEDLKYALYDARKQLKNAIIIQEGATNEDMIKAMFPNCEQKEHINNGYFEMYFDNDLRNASYMRVSKEWWNAKYRKVEE